MKLLNSVVVLTSLFTFFNPLVGQEQSGTTSSAPSDPSSASSDGGKSDGGKSATTTPSASGSSASSSSSSSGKKAQSQGTIQLTQPMRTEKSPILIAIGDVVTFKWKYQTPPTKPVAGFNIIAIRQTPQVVIYPIAANLSSDATEFEWDTKAYNDNPETTNPLIEDKNYKLYIYNSNYTYNYAAKFGELSPYATDFGMYKSKEPSDKFKFSGATVHTNSIVANYFVVFITFFVINVALF